MKLHPRLDGLRAFAREELGGRRRRHIARHLAHCARCRADVVRLREVARLRFAAADPPAGALGEVLARRERGERVILPAVPSAARRVRRIPRVAAVAVLAFAMIGIVLVRARDAGAAQSELRIEPARPTAGATLAVTYTPTSRLAGETMVTLRARVYAMVPGPGVRVVTLGTLERDGASFSGEVALPDSVAYAVLAVEAGDASFVDHFAESWEVVVHDTAGRPIYQSLRARFSDVQGRDSRIAADVADRIAALYPERTFGLRTQFLTETRELPEAARDSAASAHREQHLPRLLDTLDAMAADPYELATLVFYASEIGAPEAANRAKALLYERYPSHPSSLQRRTFDTSDAHRGRPEALLAAYDGMYDEYGASSQLAYSAFSLALRQRDTTALRRWGMRFIEVDSTFRPYVATQFARQPTLQPLAATLLRAEIARYDREPSAPVDEAWAEWLLAERPLTQTRDEFLEARRLAAGTLLTTHGTTLLALGDTVAALDTLAIAFDAGWDPARFRTIGGLHLALGDTTAAATAVARLAADPATAAASDSMRLRLGAAGEGDRWQTLVAEARATMLREIANRAIDRMPLLPRLRVVSIDGESTPVELRSTGPTVVVFWSRYCPPSFAQLADLDGLSARLLADGVRVITITGEPRESAAAFVRKNGWTFPVYFDPEMDAHRAFDQPGTPTYFVLDHDGRIRFETHAIGEVVRFVHAVRGGRTDQGQ